MIVEKYENENGDIAVLVSRGFGAGWSTWASSEDVTSEFLCMDKTLVEMAINTASEEDVIEYINDENIYTGGWEDVRVEWIPKGSAFIIEEYDGAESLQLMDKIDYMTA